MKTLKIYLSVMLLSTGLQAQTNFYNEVSQMWYDGNKTNVLSIANERLLTNSNDIVGLILKLEYESAFLDIDNMTNTMERVVTVGADIGSTNFATTYTTFLDGVMILQEVLTNYTAEDILSDRQKGSISNKPMNFGDLLKALEDDGYFQ